MCIGVIDSGIGGLTVLKELIKNNKDNEYIYIGDILNMPFGNKTKEELLEYASKMIDYLIKRDVQKIVLACGTICSTIYETLKDKYKNVELINIVYSTIDYIKSNNKDNVLVIATSNTINSKIFDIPNKKMYLQECPDLAKLIEQNDINRYSYLDSLLKKYVNKKIDLLIYGCTHYTVLDNYIKDKYNYDTLNMGSVVADKMSNGNNEIEKVEIYFTLLDNNTISSVRTILGKDYKIDEISFEGVEA